MKNDWIEQQRRRWMRNDAHLHVRQDAHRFAPPRQARSLQRRDARWDPLGALERKYSPDQPRVPAGNSDGGQWTTVSAGGGISIAVPAGQTLGGNNADAADFNGAIALPETVVSASDELGGIGDELGFGEDSDLDGFVHLAGNIPTGDPPPEIPKERPATSAERTSFLRAAARQIAAGIAFDILVVKAPWLLIHESLIETYNDSPRTLEELQEAVATTRAGTDVHHIVEEDSAAKDGFSRDAIDSPENLIRIPRLKHQEINGWYQKSNPDYGWETPRQYLSGRNWEVRRAVGLGALRKFGVLKQ